MYEFLANPPWWVVLILSIALAKLWDKLENGVKSLASYCMTHATGKLKRFLMGRKIKHLRKIKASRFSQLTIIRLTIKSYTYLTLFILCGLVGLLATYALRAVIPQHANILTPALAFIMCTTLLFEVLWLHTSSKVSDLIKYNRKIRKYSPTVKLINHRQKEDDSDEPGPLFLEIMEKLSIVTPPGKGVTVRYQPHQKNEAENTERNLRLLGFRVTHIKNLRALITHSPKPIQTIQG
ncbi:hypothetical protein [Ectopseudomonas mendocina]|uniref:hypothetical protein n=1 Tax=Ectopseudomonas mendocina TaxID=300 RepID=UPI003F00E115